MKATIVKSFELGDNWSAEHHIAKKERADKRWAAKRDRLEASISKALWGRARRHGWLNAKGKLSKSGSNAALEFIIGTASGIVAVSGEGTPAANWILLQAFLCSARGVEACFPQPSETGIKDSKAENKFPQN